MECWGGTDEYLAEAATDTLYKMHFWECVWFVKSLLILFLAVEFFLLCKDPCLMLILLFPGKLLSSGQSQTQSVKTPPSLTSPALGSPAARCLTDCCRSSASAPRWRCSGWEGEREPLLASVTGRRPALWEWDATLLGCLLRSSLNTSVTALHHFVSELSRGIWGGGEWTYVGMNSLCCLFFCPTLHARMMLTLTVCTWMWHLLSWYFIKACLGWTCPFALRNVGIHLFISNTAEACRSFFPSLVFYYINCPPLKCTKSFSLLYIVC